MLIDNLAAIRIVAKRLDRLADNMVFLGGATVGILVTDPAAPIPRATKDVDLVVEITRPDYNDPRASGFRAQLHARGFREAMDEQVICRWEIEGIKVDIMPTQNDILGFSNRWYPAAVAQAQRYQLPGGPSIRLISPACFLATKLEAFNQRGQRDFLASHDLEDIIAVVDGRESIEDDIGSVSLEIRSFLAREFDRYLATPAFRESLPGHLGGDSTSQARVPALIARLRRLSNL